ncbi:hypothetical protein SBA5_1030008 [Candidatus Sulfotelmatomonas gaucii]|uniref:Uncharacterized protein n=1 Tax=Candidatus Sulfuritelmatomonas gaucii TaxID=2043161 RepID=A0A2N9L2L7_9BACT|nr:hypothetical protein SBA5_1030008 [Candidatus Sulfotelmatomonas gaucii]
MRKLIAFIVELLLAAGLGLGIWHWWRASRATGKLPELRAVMKDEDEPRPIEPTLALQVNEDEEATVFPGTPVWFQLSAANEAAMNDVAGTRMLAAKIERLKSDVAQGHAPPESLQRAMADYQKRTAPSTITLGDASHPWTEAVQFVVRDDQGGEKPLPFALKLLGDQSATVKLDTVYTAQTNFGNRSVDIAPGTYSIAACLGATGSWRGRACSDAVKLTVELRPGKLTPDQQLALDRQKARYGLLAGDYDAIESYGRELVKADKNSGPGHIYLGEAGLGKVKNDVALQEFVTARMLYNRQNPNVGEQPMYLITRINQLLEKMLGTK